jgi:ACS family D-galactonate transporter-like MFS transporter
LDARDKLMRDLPSTDSSAPSSVRWRIVALLAAFSFMSYFTRVGIAVAGEPIRKEFGLTPTEFGSVVSSLLFGYTLSMVPGGWLADRIGPKAALSIMGVGSAGFCGLTGVVGAAGLAASAGTLLVLLVIVRGLLGVFTAPLYPAAGRMVAQWIPLDGRALANGLVIGAVPLGAALPWLLFARFMDAYGWPMAFVATSFVTFLLAAVWAWYAADHPYRHRSARALVRRGVESSLAAPAVDPELAQRRTPTRWGDLLRNRSLLLLTVSYSAVGYYEYVFFYWMGYYFEKVLKLSTDEARIYTMLPPLAMIISMPVGGWIADRLARRLGHRWGRALVSIVGLLTSAICLLIGALVESPPAIATWFTIALAAVGMCEGPVWATVVELGGPRGSTAGAIANTGNNAFGALSPIVTPWVGEHFGWPYALGLASGVCLIGAIVWLRIDPRERVGEY